MTEKQSRVETYGPWTRPIVLGIIVVGGLIPLILYWFFFGRAPTVTPTQAKTLLRAADSSAVLVDVRKPAEFSSRHIDGAINWPAAEIFALASKENIPEQFRNRTLLLVCDAGVVSSSAAKHLIGLCMEEVKNVRLICRSNPRHLSITNQSTSSQFYILTSREGIVKTVQPDIATGSSSLGGFCFIKFEK